MTDKPKRGRPPLSDKPSVKFTLKMPPEDRQELELLGGAEWIRQQIHKARKRRLRTAS